MDSVRGLGCNNELPTCVDSANWVNPSGVDCAAYATEGHCADGKVVPGHEWAAGDKFGRPESNCCVCGMRSRPMTLPSPLPSPPPSPSPPCVSTDVKINWQAVCSKTYCSRAYMESLTRKSQEAACLACPTGASCKG